MVVADDHPIYREGIVRAINERPDLDLVGEPPTAARRWSRSRALPDVAVLDIHARPRRHAGALGDAPRRARDRGPLPVRLHGARARLPHGRQRRPRLPLEGVLAPGGLRGDRDHRARRHSRSPPRPRPGSRARSRSASAPAGGRISPLASRRCSTSSPRALGARHRQADPPSTTTVKSHLHSLYEKLGPDRAAAVAEAMRRGLLE